MTFSGRGQLKLQGNVISFKRAPALPPVRGHNLQGEI